MLDRGLVEEKGGELLWTGKDSRVTFIGDILGDRTAEGIKIYTVLNNLEKQAEKAGGSISWLSGNHENMFNAVLGGFSSERGVPVEKDMSDRLYQYSGNLELCNFLTNKQKVKFLEGLPEIKSDLDVAAINAQEKLDKFNNNPSGSIDFIRTGLEHNVNAIKKSSNVLASLIQRFSDAKNNSGKINLIFSDILSNPEYYSMRLHRHIGLEIIKNRDSIKSQIKKTKEGIGLLDAMKKQKLVSVNDDVLYVHTSLTAKMVDSVRTFANGKSFVEGVSELNEFYQKMLTVYIDNNYNIDDIPSITQEHKKYFDLVRDIFISTSKESRINYSEDSSLSESEKEGITNYLKSSGINMVIHGHTDERGDIKGKKNVLPIVSIDSSVYKEDSAQVKKPTSVATVDTAGRVIIPK